MATLTDINMTLKNIAALALFALLLSGCGAGGSNAGGTTSQNTSIETGEQTITLRSDGGAAVIQRSPVGLRFETADGETVLASTPQSALPFSARALDPQRGPLGTDLPNLPPLYAPFTFVVGVATQLQFPATFWVGNLLASNTTGIEYRLQDVTSVTPIENGVRMQVSTSDPSGRTATLTVVADTAGTFKTTLRLQPVNQDVPLVTAAFTSHAGEAFHGFGGRRNAIDQRGQDFINWAEEFHQTPQQAAFPGNPVFEENFQFPTGAQGAYYVQSMFISSENYGFLMARDELSHWRMASDRDDAWMVEVAGPQLDFVVAPGDSPTAINKLTQITGRHRLPTAQWQLGPMLSEAVQSGESAAQYNAKVQESLNMIRDLNLPVSAFIFEGWSGLQDLGTYQQTVDTLTAMDVIPLTYYRAFVADTDDLLERPAVFDEAIAQGYVATNIAGAPFLFGSPLTTGLAALIDFTNPQARAWWKARIKQGLREGSHGFMQDFGEQTFTDMVFADGSSGIEMHNRYARLYNQATREAFDEFLAENPDNNVVAPWFFVRNGTTGLPGSAAFESASWTGDNTADWSRPSGIGAVIPDMLNRSIGGAYGNVTEIGGYIDTLGRPSKELVIRWSQQASLMPVHRLHGGPVNGTHMPWRYDQETVDEYARTARRHIAAQPLIMDLWREALRTGMPIMRPLWLAYPDDAQAAVQDQQYLLGPNVLVAPVVTEAALSRDVYFPDGCWRHPEDGSEYVGPRTETVPAPLNYLPYYFRCGTTPFPVPDGGF